MFIKSLMFVCYDFMNIKINLSVSYRVHGVSPFTPRHPMLYLGGQSGVFSKEEDIVKEIKFILVIYNPNIILY